jgi:hypothetical protein
MYNEKIYYRYLIILGICVFGIIFYLRGGQFEISILGTVFSAAGITLLLDMVIFKTLIWKLCPDFFYKLSITNIPFLGGEWEGTLESDYIFPDTGESIPPISSSLYIKHKFDRIHIIMETDKSHSSSYISGITEDEGKQKFLCYLYGNDADKDRHINPKHDGATRLRIKHDGEILLEGHYWTGRKTTGSMKFRRIIKTTRVNGWFVLRLKASVTGQPFKGHRKVRQPHYLSGKP